MVTKTPALMVATVLLTCGLAAAQTTSVTVPLDLHLRILQAEDQRRWDPAAFAPLLSDMRPAVRQRALLAAGRIGDPLAVSLLAARLRSDEDADVRAMAAFALGEIESPEAVAPLLDAVRLGMSAAARARAVEALGKIAAALPPSQAALQAQIGRAVVAALAEEQRRVAPNRDLVLLALTAAFRAPTPESAGVAAGLLDSADAAVRAAAANTLARLRAREALPRLRALLQDDPDAIVRANAARVLGAAADPETLPLLLRAATGDPDLRVRVSAVRGLAATADRESVEPLVARGETLLAALRTAKADGDPRPPQTNELLEITTTVGRARTLTDDARAIRWLRELRREIAPSPEVDVALARIGPAAYVNPLLLRDSDPTSWQQLSVMAQALAAVATLAEAPEMVRETAAMRIRSLLGAPETPLMAVPDLLRALQAFAPGDLAATARAFLQAPDPIVRATAAGILGSLPPDLTSAQALATALPRALEDRTNDAALAIVTALGPQVGDGIAAALEQAMESPDYLVRRRASAVIAQRSGSADGPSAGLADSRDRRATYERALARIGRQVQAVVTTDAGEVTLELLPREAPLTVDNFIELAMLDYFDGLAFHRVLANFVVQGGDPRGDGTGGPGHEIRCEINTVPHDTGVLAMALSGKDTGGSQVYITHSPQPHLDGGYTVFGRIVAGQDVVDRLVRGDRILNVVIVEDR